MDKIQRLIIWICKRFWLNMNPNTVKLSALNVDEKKLRQKRLSRFKINYQYRDYHFQPGELKIAEIESDR